MRVPYLEDRPEVIPIGVGRQLFVDDFLVESTTLTRRVPPGAEERAQPRARAGDGSRDERRRVSCRGAVQRRSLVGLCGPDCSRCGTTRGGCPARGTPSARTASSGGGPSWTSCRGRTSCSRPGPGTCGTAAACGWTTGPRTLEQRFKMFQYFRSSGEIGEPWSGGEVYTSPDGIHWGEPTRTGMLGDNSTFFYNPFRRKWVYSVRRTEGGVRARRYIEHDDFLEGSQWEEDEPVLWSWSDELDEPDHGDRRRAAAIRPERGSVRERHAGADRHISRPAEPGGRGAGECPRRTT